MKLRQRTLLITGGTSGVGKALVEQLAPINTTIIVVARDGAKLATLAEQFPNVRTFSCSLAEPESLEHVTSEIIRSFPDLSVIINNAGIQSTPALLSDDFKYESIDQEIAVNLAAPIKICALTVSHMLRIRPQAAYVNLSSGLAIFPKAGSAVYCATKAGLRSFSTSLRYQLEQTSVSVHEAILPLVDTPMTKGRGAGKISSAKAATAIIQGVERNKAEIYVGKARFIPPLARLSPSLMAKILRSG